MSHDLNNAPKTLSRRNVIAGLPAVGLAAGGLGTLLSMANSAAAQEAGQGEQTGVPKLPGKLSKVLHSLHDGNAYTLPPLPYAHDALEPVIDALTMELHHGKHHQGYVDGLNKAVERMGNEEDPTAMGGLARNLSFNYGGHVLHSLFWAVMGPGENGDMGGEPTGQLAEAIDKDLGGFDGFKTLWNATAGTVKGSGWVTLLFDPMAVRLHVAAIGDHDRHVLPGTVPLLPLDIWEHAYYLTYQNRRADYVKAFLEVIDWSVVNALYGMVSAPYRRG